MDKLVDYIREELEKQIKLKRSWARIEIMPLFDKAWILGMARYAREKGINLD
jgi:hypothetical protein